MNNQELKAGTYMMPFLILCVLIIIGWKAYHTQIMLVYFKASYFLFLPFSWLGSFFDNPAYINKDLKDGIGVVDQLGLKTIFLLGNQIGRYYYILLFPIVLIVLNIAITHPARKAKRKFDFQALLEFQMSEWKSIIPVVYRDLIFDTSEGWKPSLSPLEWAKKHNLLSGGQFEVLPEKERLKTLIQKKVEDGNLISNEEAEFLYDKELKKEPGKLDYKKAFEALKNQLGKSFERKNLKSYEKALFCVFASRILREQNGSLAKKYLDAINVSTAVCDFSWTKSKLFGLIPFPGYVFKNIDPDFMSITYDFNKLFDEYCRKNKVREVIHGFYYTRTVLMQMYVEARRYDGKLPPAEFLWLRPIDRNLWYALQRAPVEVGRLQVAAFAEGFAVAALWQAEMQAKNYNEKLKKLSLRSALTGLVIELEKVGAIQYDLFQYETAEGTKTRDIGVKENKKMSESDAFFDVLNNVVCPALDGQTTKITKEGN